MQKEKNKNDYKKLYEEYQELRAKTNLSGYRKIPGKKINAKHIRIEDINKLAQIEKRLIRDYKDLLSFEDKTEIEKDLKSIRESIIKSKPLGDSN